MLMCNYIKTYINYTQTFIYTHTSNTYTFKHMLIHPHMYLHIYATISLYNHTHILLQPYTHIKHIYLIGPVFYEALLSDRAGSLHMLTELLEGLDPKVKNM